MLQRKATTMDLVHGRVFRTLLVFALPLMLSSLLQTLYSTVDTIVVGQYVGSAGLSAVSISANLVHLSIALCMGLSSAGQILIAQHLGANRREEAKRVVVTIIIVTTLFSIFLGVIVLIFLDPLLRLLSTPAEAFEMARQYMIISAVGILFTGLYNMMSAVFRGMGDSRRPFMFILISSLLNVALDVLFVGVLRWSAAGAALATVISQAVSVVYSFVFLMRHREAYCFDFRQGEFRVAKTELKMLLRLGFPLMLSTSAVSISGLFVSKFVNELGVAVSAAFGVGQKLSQIPNIIAQAIGQAGAAMMGQNLGAKQFDRVRQIVRCSVGINCVVVLSFSAFCLFFPELSFRIFTQDVTVLAYASEWTIAMAIGAPAMSCMSSFNGLIQAVGDTKISMAIGFADAFVGRLVLTILLGIVLDLGAMGFFCGYTAAAYLTLIPGMLYYRFVHWEDRVISAKKA